MSGAARPGGSGRSTDAAPRHRESGGSTSDYSTGYVYIGALMAATDAELSGPDVDAQEALAAERRERYMKLLSDVAKGGEW